MPEAKGFRKVLDSVHSVTLKRWGDVTTTCYWRSSPSLGAAGALMNWWNMINEFQGVSVGQTYLPKTDVHNYNDWCR